MRGLISVQFRGEEQDAEIFSFEDGCVEWGFYGLSPEGHDALKVTDEEDDAIHAYLSEVLSDPPTFEDDVSPWGGG